MLEKTYTPAEVETRQYARWEEAGAFGCGHTRGSETNGRAFTIVIPPPNVTGSLHMGHALNNTLQDILVRFERMRGRDALWQPGTDHAGIATQMVVERQLAAEGRTRQELGRDAFIERVWKWKDESGGTIIGQLRRLGASCDWARERFTMDDGLSAAVRKVFVTLYREGLIYRDKRLVNWDPKLHTAISDLEVENRETVGKLWYFRYPLEDGSGHITVATTRPETMLGDTAVAVHPEDERYRDLVGKHVVLPLVGRRIPIVADEYADPEKGTGAVKITPAHDFNDFEVGRRHGLEMITILDEDARISDEAPERFRGLDRFEARETRGRRAGGARPAREDRGQRHDGALRRPVGRRHRAAAHRPVVRERRRTGQARGTGGRAGRDRIRAAPLGEHLLRVDAQHPALVHLAPALVGPPDPRLVRPRRAHLRGRDRGRGEARRRSSITARRRSSSATPTCSTPGSRRRSGRSRRSAGPTTTPELAHYYPTDVLVTGFDIIFFWVARMMMMGLHFREEVPFHTVYIHALVRDERGQKMSKSKGNVLDPLELIDDYGADALRFTLTALAAQGRDIKLAPGRVEGYRNFVTKLWNAARYAEMNGCVGVAGFDPAAMHLTVNRWIVGEPAACERAVTEALGEYRFNDAAGAIYQFTWHTFCDWYLEFTKPILQARR